MFCVEDRQGRSHSAQLIEKKITASGVSFVRSNVGRKDTAIQTTAGSVAQLPQKKVQKGNVQQLLRSWAIQPAYDKCIVNYLNIACLHFPLDILFQQFIEFSRISPLYHQKVIVGLQWTAVCQKRSTLLLSSSVSLNTSGLIMVTISAPTKNSSVEAQCHRYLHGGAQKGAADGTDKCISIVPKVGNLIDEKQKGLDVTNKMSLNAFAGFMPAAQTFLKLYLQSCACCAIFYTARKTYIKFTEQSLYLTTRH